jgi:small-conductance mechanosensitive channel
MDRLLELLLDHDTPEGRLVSTAAVVILAILAGTVVSRLAAARVSEPYERYYVRKVVRYGAAAIALIAVAIVWRAFAGRAGVVLGLAAAGLAFAMQEVVGAFAGWINILSGRIFRVGDRIQMGGVRGDVIDVTPLRTKILEIGSPGDEASWVKGRQPTGRIVAVSNKATFTEPVFNYSSAFDFLWEELSLPISYDSDWREAERILHEEASRVSASAEARTALEEMARRYPLPRAELEPRVFARATDNWMELSARFVVPVRSARSVKDSLTRRVRERFDAAGVQFASETLDITLRRAQPREARAPEDADA